MKNKKTTFCRPQGLKKQLLLASFLTTFIMATLVGLIIYGKYHEKKTLSYIYNDQYLSVKKINAMELIIAESKYTLAGVKAQLISGPGGANALKEIKLKFESSWPELKRVLEQEDSQKIGTSVQKVINTSQIFIDFINQSIAAAESHNNEKIEDIFDEIWPDVITGMIKPFEKIRNIKTKLFATRFEQLEDENEHMINTALLFGPITIILIFVISIFFVHALNKKLQTIVLELIQRFKSMAIISKNAGEDSHILENSSTESAEKIQETVSSLDEISSMIEKSSESIKHSTENTKKSKEIATAGEQAVDKVIIAISEIDHSNIQISETVESNGKKMNEIVDMISNIAEKTKVINDIVFQTKLLSFNASVEAARAGEHGKGFSVVAEEVGNLASMSGKAAEEITGILSESINTVNNIAKESMEEVEKLMKVSKEKIVLGKNTAKDCKNMLQRISANVTTINDMSSEISIASNEQSLGVKEISNAMNRIDQLSQDNDLLAKRSLQNAKALGDEAQSLESVIHHIENIISGKASLKLESQTSIQKNITEKSIKKDTRATKEGQKQEIPVKAKASNQKTNIIEFKKSKSINKETKKASRNQDLPRISQTKVMMKTSHAPDLPSADDPRFEEI